MATEVREGDVDYSRLLAVWNENGQSTTFEELGEFGGRMWRCVRDGDNVFFLLSAAAGPTEPGSDKPIGWVARTGYEATMHDTGLRISQGPGGEGDRRFTMRPFPKDTTI